MRNQGNTCAADDCDSPAYCRGHCSRHYRRVKQYGNTSAVHRTGPRARPLIDRFWERVDQRGTDECWEWTGVRHPFGYGQLSLAEGRRGALVLAHRLSWEIHHGPVPDGLVVRHVVCGNPPCVNLAHLAIGTPADNVADTVRMGRTARGSNATLVKHPELVRRGSASNMARLTEDDVRHMRSLHAAGGVNLGELSARFSVAKPTVCLIVNRKTWKHVD